MTQERVEEVAEGKTQPADKTAIDASLKRIEEALARLIKIVEQRGIFSCNILMPSLTVSDW